MTYLNHFSSKAFELLISQGKREETGKQGRRGWRAEIHSFIHLLDKYLLSTYV